MPVIEDLLIGMAAVVAALVVFGILVQVGLRIVTLLRLPQDPPEGAWFSPPAPPLAANLSPAEARERARLQAWKRRLARSAHLAQRAALICRDRVSTAPDAETRRRSTEIADRAKAAAEAADKAWRGDTPDAQGVRSHLRQALQARREARAVFTEPDSEGPRRRRILIMLLVLAVLWVFSLTLMFAH